MVVGMEEKDSSSDSNINGSDSDRISIAQLLNAHGVECVVDTLIDDDGDGDQNDNPIANAFLSLIHNTRIRHPRVIVAIDERVMEVVVYAVNPIYVNHRGWYGMAPHHCIYQTAHYLLPKNREPVKKWQMAMHCSYKYRHSPNPVPHFLVLVNNLLLWSRNANGKRFVDNRWIRLDYDTEITKKYDNQLVVNTNIFGFDHYEFSFDSKFNRDKRFAAITRASKTTVNERAESYYYYVPHSGKRESPYNFGRNDEEEEEPTAPSTPSIADRIQPWTGAIDATCYSVLGGGCYSSQSDSHPHHPVVISFHCLYHSPNKIQKYIFYDGKWKRMGMEVSEIEVDGKRMGML